MAKMLEVVPRLGEFDFVLLGGDEQVGGELRDLLLIDAHGGSSGAADCCCFAAAVGTDLGPPGSLHTDHATTHARASAFQARPPPHTSGGGAVVVAQHAPQLHPKTFGR